jgi:NAD(P)-dependent dehydrogenase (short-subunit alcohol dehydrogenase family)
MDLEESEWTDDINLNLNIPFYLARAAMQKMDERCGRIVFIGTESAIHGGSPTGLPYAVAKRGLECLVQGLAREGAGSEIMVNGVRAGLIRTGAHERWQGKTEEDMKKRAEMVPVKRAGEPEEAAALIVYLLSGWAGFITGQMLPLTGGDWL